MLYRFVKILMTTGLRFFYRHIHVTGLKNIPAKGPVIIIANHAASVMDAAVLGILLKRQIHFFARGDVFVNKPVRKILSWLHMMPVHNHDAGRHTLDANTGSFSEAQRILTNGGIIVFFPEATSHIERQLLPFRKGVFRLAFQTAVANNFSFEIAIVPAGITYDHPVDGGKDVQVHIAEPIFLSAYKQAYLDNAPATLLYLSKYAYELTFKKVLHISDKDRLQLAERWLVMHRNRQVYNSMRWKIASDKQLQQEQNICTWVNTLTADEANKIRQQQAAYFDSLHKHRMNDKAMAAARRFPSWKKIVAWMGFPFYIAGLLLNAPPVWLAKRIADKKVTRIDFYSWIFVACYVLLYLGWLIVVSFLTVALAGWSWLLVVLPTIILTGIFSYYYNSWLKDYMYDIRLRSFSAEKLNLLVSLRTACTPAILLNGEAKAADHDGTAI
jgi:1-acyl-sn-glycerol-3-phosphate acyltransferase